MIEKKYSMHADGWINEEKIKEIKTTNEVGLGLVWYYIKMNARNYCQYKT